MIKLNKLIIIYIKTQYYLLEQFSLNIIRNIFSSCSKWTTSQQCRGSCWSLRDWCCCYWRRVLSVFLFVEQNGFLCWTSHLQVVSRCRWKGSINARSKNSVYIQLIIFPKEFNIVQISRHLIPACVQFFLCTYAWKCFVPHLMCSLLAGGNWSSRQMIVQELLSLRQQQAPSCQRNFMGTYCQFLEQIFYSQCHWIWSKIERPLNAVVGDWENHAVLL